MKALIKATSQVGGEETTRPGLYLNNAATSWPKPEAVCQEVSRVLRDPRLAGSACPPAEASGIVTRTRGLLAELFSIPDPERITITSNVTEALNICLQGLLKPGDHAIMSSMEHNSVARPLYALQQAGVELTVVECAPDGTLEPEKVAAAWRENTRLVCVSHASNVTGTIIPVRDIGEIAHRHGGLLVVDAAQTAGVLPISVEQDMIDVLGFTGHKGLLGPQGTGGYYVRQGIEIRPLIEGDACPNLPGIAGLGAGVECVLKTGTEVIREHEARLTDVLLEGLSEIRGVEVYGLPGSDGRVAVVSFNIRGLDCGMLSYLLEEEYGIATRSGLHCSPLAHKTMGTLERGACRISPGPFNTLEDMGYAVNAVRNIACYVS